MTRKHFEWAAQWIGRRGGILSMHAMTTFACALFNEFGRNFDESKFRAAIKKEFDESI